MNLLDYLVSQEQPKMGQQVGHLALLGLTLLQEKQVIGQNKSDKF